MNESLPQVGRTYLTCLGPSPIGDQPGDFGPGVDGQCEPIGIGLLLLACEKYSSRVIDPAQREEFERPVGDRTSHRFRHVGEDIHSRYQFPRDACGLITRITKNSLGAG